MTNILQKDNYICNIIRKHIKLDCNDKFEALENTNKLISIITINNCNLNCHFCRGGLQKDDLAEYSRYKIMSTEEFKNIVDKCLDGDKQFFDLTPAIGEPFLDKNFIEKLQILEDDDRALEYTFTTNLLLLKEADVIKLASLKKLILDISLYGNSKDEYLKNTDKDKYDDFLKQLEMLYALCGSTKIRFIQRCNLEQDTLLSQYVSTFRKNKMANLTLSEQYNLNRAGQVSDNPARKRSGVCPYGPGGGGGIVSGGNVLFCPFHDFKRDGVVGNIFNKSLNEIYHDAPWKKIINSHTNNEYTGMCKNCDESW